MFQVLRSSTRYDRETAEAFGQPHGTFGDKVPGTMPGMSLSLFLFGIFALIVIVLWDPINAAMQDSRAAVAGGFAIALVLGILLVFVGSRRASSAACD